MNGVSRCSVRTNGERFPVSPQRNWNHVLKSTKYPLNKTYNNSFIFLHFATLSYQQRIIIYSSKSTCTLTSIFYQDHHCVLHCVAGRVRCHTKLSTPFVSWLFFSVFKNWCLSSLPFIHVLFGGLSPVYLYPHAGLSVLILSSVGDGRWLSCPIFFLVLRSVCKVFYTSWLLRKLCHCSIVFPQIEIEMEMDR